jgi:hypothetical protein
LTLWRLLKIEDCIERWSAPYIGEKKRTLGKTHGIKASYYWEPMEYTENLLGNPLRT